MATNEIRLNPVKTGGRFMGFGNMFRKENSDWWRTKTWLIHSILWLLLINGTVFAILSVPPEIAENPGYQPPPPGAMMFVIMAGMMTGIGVIIVMQGAILDEKKSGTAAWVLSKPLSRPAFILAKLAANSLATVMIMIVLQGAVTYVLLLTFEQNPPALVPFAAGVGLLALHLLFYLALTLMLGTISSSRGIVLGIPLALLLGAQMLMGFAPALAQIMPWGITMPLDASGLPMANVVIDGLPLANPLPVIATAVWIVIFVGVSLWGFRREEF
jgi:ABC-2 type transport system permease protein